MEKGNKHYKEYVQRIFKKYNTKFKYKRTIWNTKDLYMIEVYDNNLTIFNKFLIFDLQSHNKRNNTSVYTVKKQEIDNCIEKGYYID